MVVNLLIIKSQLKKKLHPDAPQKVTGVINSDGSIKVTWDSVEEAQAYVTHYGGANQADPKEAKFMGYSETTTWTLKAADVPELEAGDKIYIYVQSFREKGEGANEIEKARFLNEGAFTGSPWSKEVVLTAK